MYSRELMRHANAATASCQPGEPRPTPGAAARRHLPATTSLPPRLVLAGSPSVPQLPNRSARLLPLLLHGS